MLIVFKIVLLCSRIKYSFRKVEVIPPITDYMIPVNFCKNIINIKNEYISTKFDFFSEKKMDALYLTESMLTEWLHMLDAYCDEKDTSYSDDFGFWPEWLFEYFNDLPLGEAI